MIFVVPGGIRTYSVEGLVIYQGFNDVDTVIPLTTMSSIVAIRKFATGMSLLQIIAIGLHENY